MRRKLPPRLVGDTDLGVEIGTTNPITDKPQRTINQKQALWQLTKAPFPAILTLTQTNRNPGLYRSDIKNAILYADKSLYDNTLQPLAEIYYPKGY